MRFQGARGARGPFGDGICCDSYYSVFYEDELVCTGGGNADPFSERTCENVTGGCGDVTLDIEVFTDRDSGETTWQVVERETGSLAPPKHILNAPTTLMKDLGYGNGYAYDHDTEDGFSGQNYFPDGMARQRFYQPRDRGFERDIIKRLAYWDKLRDKKGRGRIRRRQYMSAKMLIWVAFGGAAGSVARYLMMSTVGHVTHGGFPYATLVVNVVGAFVLGSVIEIMALTWSPSPELRALLYQAAIDATWPRMNLGTCSGRPPWSPLAEPAIFAH